MGILKGYLIMAATQTPVPHYGHGLPPHLLRLKEAARPTIQKSNQNQPKTNQVPNQTRLIKKGKSIIPEVMPSNCIVLN